MRCYTANFSKSLLQKGISTITITGRESTEITFHSFGMFFGPRKAISRHQQVLLEAREKVRYVVENENYQALDLNGEACNQTLAYNQDACIKDQLWKESLQKFNCTTPFGLDKSSICEDPGVGMQAPDLYKKYEFNYQGSCLEPCYYLRLKIMQMKYVRDDHFWTKDFEVMFDFEEKVKKSTSYYRYTFLSLVAEIGGYVGLFLGLSVYQLKDVFHGLFQKF